MQLLKLVFIFLVSTFSLSAQIENPVSWDFSSKHIEGDFFELNFTASIQDGWTVYSQFTSDEGPIPTEITYESSFEKVGKSIESGHKKEGYDKIFDMDVIKFLSDEDYRITQKVRAPSGTKVTGYLTFMTCDDEKCLPPTDIDFSILLNGDNGTSSEKDNSQPDNDDGLESSTDQTSLDVPSEGESINGESDNNGSLEQDGTGTGGLLNPVVWDFAIQKISDSDFELIYTAKIDEGWTIYSQFTNDDGPVPTSVNYETEEGFTLSGTSSESGHKKEGFDKIFDVDVIKFLGDEDFVIQQKISVTDPEVSISGWVNYMACDDEKCLTPTDAEFQFTPSKLYAGAPIISGDVSMKLKGNVLDQKNEKIIATLADPVGDCGSENEISNNLLLTFVFGFLGGLLALLTPCVFPMIPLTISFFTKDTRRKGWVNGLIYGLSIIGIYVSIGLLLTAAFGPEVLNALSTNWIVNTLFFLIFLFFAFSFFGYYEITLPSSWSNKSDKAADRGGIIGIFFMAFTLAIVSFSCTGPIIGTALVQAADSGRLGPGIVMLGFSTALALPFGLFAAFPSWLNSLPKSGGWMNSVKVVLGFLEVALAFKFLSVADMTSHWGVLRYEPFMIIWVVVAALTALYLFGIIRFPHDSPVRKFSIPRVGFALFFTVAAIYLATGFRYNEKTQAYSSLSLMSGLAPPAQYNFFLDRPGLDPVIKAKYPSFTKCANNLDCFKDYYEGLSYARENNKPVLVDFTGYGCVNCRKTEEHIWIKDPVWESLKNDFVMLALYVDDRKGLDEMLYSKNQDNGTKKLRTVGSKWADFQIVNFGSNSQPLYIIMAPDETVLSKPRAYHDGWKDYKEFLDCGLETYNNYTGNSLLGSN